MVISNFVVCSSKESGFIKEQDACGLLSSLRITRTLSLIPLVGTLLF